ncbi:chemotaxis protein CheX [Anaeromicropila populeti]|uniref:Chemotaxis phosphatase CheX n=1 Tax=Anaeromicropila populeti TaxID=37658 RepID=A0A1I6L401_9FIRM|nr:chemotaxis protein CheX [Anaeromicropila populeti]SFR98213.1 Chemotaxis phosphatase CheX [Anaeromicropila populeti]
MFIHFFGNYLIHTHKLSNQQFNEILALQKSSRVKLGLIAVAENLLNAQQANEINHLQVSVDKRFGDIAIEKGYLSEEQVVHLLKLQGDPYMAFVQAATDLEYFTISEINALLKEYQTRNHLSNENITALKSGDIDKIAPIFTDLSEPLCMDHIGLILRNIMRFISTDIYLEHTYSVKDYAFVNLASQCLTGDHNIFVGFASSDNSLLEIANPYAKEEFTALDEDSFDSICEFINCVNGLFATRLSEENVDVDMLPPVFYTDCTLKTNGHIYVVPVFINGKRNDLLISINSAIDIQ